MVSKVLMIAFHASPEQASSGIQRTLGFARHLPASGWQPLILTVRPVAYGGTGSSADPGGLHITRSFALDAARHLAIGGRYPSWLALPDRWSSWLLSGVPAGLRLIRQHRPALIWSTFPIASAHLIGLALHRLSGIPWVADLRDPMTEAEYPPDPRLHQIYRWIEGRVMARSAAIVCTTRSARTAYRQRYPQAAARCHLIENGYDEATFATAEASAATPTAHRQVITMLHSGVIYPSERDPTALFKALAMLRDGGEIGPRNFALRLRASGHDSLLAKLIAQYELTALVTLAPPLPYAAALSEMLQADALLLLQAANCNAQIPAKLYEYLRAGRPILALTDPAGDSAATLRDVGVSSIAALDSAAAIGVALREFLARVRSGTAPMASPLAVAGASRASRTHELAALFNQLVR